MIKVVFFRGSAIMVQQHGVTAGNICFFWLQLLEVRFGGSRNAHHVSPFKYQGFRRPPEKSTLLGVGEVLGTKLPVFPAIVLRHAWDSEHHPPRLHLPLLIFRYAYPFRPFADYDA